MFCNRMENPFFVFISGIPTLNILNIFIFVCVCVCVLFYRMFNLFFLIVNENKIFENLNLCPII